MKPYREQRVLPFSAQELFELVTDIQKYPEFLPWCLNARVERSGPQRLKADLTIGYKVFKESYTSCVSLEPHTRILAVQEKGPFKYLETCWTFKALDIFQCEVTFYLFFEFQSSTFNFLMGQIFEKAAPFMMQAFEKRAQTLYGKREIAKGLAL